MRIACSILAITILFSACHFINGQHISGNGRIITQQKNPGSFDRVDVSGAVKVHVRQQGTASVRIEADENLLPYIDVYTHGSTLTIRTKQGYSLDPTREVVAYVTAPSFRDIEVSGACDIIGDGPVVGTDALDMHVSGSGDMEMEVDLSRVSAEISGSGTIRLKGKADDFSANVSGSGNVKCFDLQAGNINVDLSGAADAEVNASRQLKVQVSGAGTVKYKGSPSINQSISGSGSIQKQD